jgi:hypothetical protein
MSKRKLLLSIAMTGGLLLVLFMALTGSWSGGVANAQPAPDPYQHSPGSGNTSLFSAPRPSAAALAPENIQGLDFSFAKSVVLWHDGQGDSDCDSGGWTNRVLVVNHGDAIRYCYIGTNIGSTDILTHTMYDEGLNAYALKNSSVKLIPGAHLSFYTGPAITITEETVGNAWWQVIDANQDELTRYQSTLVKVAIRFRGYTYNALPSAPTPYPPMPNVTLQLYGWNEGDVITESLRMTTTSDAGGFWNFYMPDTYDHYLVQAMPTAGHVVVDVISDTGTVVGNKALQWDTPDRAIVHQSKFFFAIPTPTPTPTITPTPTATPTLPPDMKPSIWLPVVVQ